MEQPLNENYETYNDGSAPSNEVFIDSPPEVKPVAQKLTNGINQAIATVGTNRYCSGVLRGLSKRF